jgi:hypothetical protein
VVIDEAVARRIALLEWNDPDGVPERTVPGLLTSFQSDVPVPVRRGGVELRALPDGTPQALIALPELGMARAIGLSAPPTVIDFKISTEAIDVVLDTLGGAITLERHGATVTVRSISPDGEQAWSIGDLAVDAPDARLLTDAQSRVFLATDRALLSVRDGRSEVVARWQPGGEPFMEPGGRVAFVRYDPTREVRDWVLLDPRSGVESVTGCSNDSWGFMSRAIGVDGEGRAYGYGGGVLGRVALDGQVEWRLSVAGATVDERYGVSLLAAEGEGEWTLTDRHGRWPIRLPLEYSDATLIGRADDGSCLFYSRNLSGAGLGMLLKVDPHGSILDSRPAGEDVWLTNDDFRPPSASAVTPDGGVLVSVLGPAGVHVVKLSPKP